MSALQQVLAAARADGRAALIGYLPVGYPDIPRSIAAMLAMVEGGVDIVEVGVPYSDPVMDGPTIQAAVDPAVRAGVGMTDAVAAVRAVADAGAVAVVMSYWNPIERYGVEQIRGRPGRRGRFRRDYPRPDPGRGDAVAGRDRCR